MVGDVAKISLVVGLGNPGAEYSGTRHNAGFMVIDRLLSQLPSGRFELRHIADSMVYTGRFRGRTLHLQKPQTFMNLSGLAVAGFARKNQISPEEILVISDDLDLTPGRLRLRRGGSDGGHNGLKSVIAELGGSNFNRLRIGIGRGEGREVIDYVLDRFSAGEKAAFDESIDRAAAAVKTVLAVGVDRAMNKVNAPEPGSVAKQ